MSLRCTPQPLNLAQFHPRCAGTSTVCVGQALGGRGWSSIFAATCRRRFCKSHSSRAHVSPPEKRKALKTGRQTSGWDLGCVHPLDSDTPGQLTGAVLPAVPRSPRGLLAALDCGSGCPMSFQTLCGREGLEGCRLGAARQPMSGPDRQASPLASWAVEGGEAQGPERSLDRIRRHRRAPGKSWLPGFNSASAPCGCVSWAGCSAALCLSVLRTGAAMMAQTHAPPPPE